ncbi:unnamed protein product [Rotaria sp. Silwood2]|nr:unnamed protein product [Rotaria sp. Silwood2]CAF4516599.1 unnamed protein product [Rotaria sp. Silwood2]
MSSNRSRTITAEQTREQCRTVILRLTQPTKNSAANEQQRMLNDLQNRVNNRFHILVQKFVIDEKEQINCELLEKLKKVKDPNIFLEALLTHLYGKAVKQEEGVVSPYVTEEEIHEINNMVEHYMEKK